ncbi:MAG: isopeptide-forming domain-containing fimbrial protein, partial [Clostridium sp.]
MKKVISLFVAMLVLLSVGVPAFANTKGNIIIKNTTANTGITLTNEKYYAYKVMDLVVNVGGSPQGYTVDPNFKKFFTDKASKSNPIEIVDTDEKLNEFANKYLNDNKGNIIEVAREIKTYIGSENKPTVTIVEDGQSGEITPGVAVQTATIPNLNLGYYIIVDKTITDAEHVIAAAALGANFPGLEIELKASKPTLDKKIFHNEDKSWGNVGDNAIGDKVEFRLEGKLPQNITVYNSYTYIMHDTLDKGLTFNDDIRVYVVDKDDSTKKVELDTNYYTVEKNVTHKHNNKDITDGKTGFDLSVKVKEGIADSKFKLGDILYVYYSATLNKDALVADKSNDNSVYLEYSNNPYDENSKEEGPEIVVRDYTFKLNGLKTNEKNEPLKGAEFN